jgi:hypothetical protein
VVSHFAAPVVHSHLAAPVASQVVSTHVAAPFAAPLAAPVAYATKTIHSAAAAPLINYW